MEQPDRRMARIYDEWYQPLAAFIRTSFGLTGEIEDLMQDIMLKVHQNLASYDSRYALSTWLYTIARNTCIDSLKRARLPMEALTHEPVGRQSTEHACINREIEIVVDRVLQGLEPTDRGIAWLAFYERASYRRIAQVFELPTTTIKMRVHRIRKLLKGQLEDYHA